MRTVFVIGAGANVEIGMPDGNRLKESIAERLNMKHAPENGDEIIYSALKESVKESNGTVNEYIEKALMDVASNILIAMPLAISIDSYIEAHKDDRRITLCGKLGITRVILDAERECALFTAYGQTESLKNTDEKVTQLNNSWYPLFFEKITDGCSFNELEFRFRNVSFIIFNYDRCFEYFMYNALMNYYHINSDKAEYFVQHLHINHPYGTVGNLWDDKGRLTFGETPDSRRLMFLAQRIKTFTESENIDQEEDDKNRVKYLVDRADRIIFLGFAYHDQNLDLLFKQRGVIQDAIPPSENITCYGTGYQVSDNDQVTVRRLLEQANKKIKIKECIISETDITCARFFKKFWYTLSFKEPENS